MKPTVLIADDEPSLREQLERLLCQFWPEAKLVASTGNGEETRTALQDLAPDVAFLDIRMPAPNGLQLAEEFANGSILVVFVTAYDEFAVDAFEKNACDYLLKPVSDARFSETVARLKQRLANADSDSTIAAIRDVVDKLSKSNKLQRLPVRYRGETKLVDVSEIRYFKSDARYTLAYDASNEYVLSISLRQLEQQLDEHSFWRIHRNCIVNANYIETVKHDSNESLVVEVKDRTEELRVSRIHRYRFREL